MSSGPNNRNSNNTRTNAKGKERANKDRSSDNGASTSSTSSSNSSRKWTGYEASMARRMAALEENNLALKKSLLETNDNIVKILESLPELISKGIQLSSRPLDELEDAATVTESSPAPAPAPISLSDPEKPPLSSYPKGTIVYDLPSRYFTHDAYTGKLDAQNLAGILQPADSSETSPLPLDGSVTGVLTGNSMEKSGMPATILSPWVNDDGPREYKMPIIPVKMAKTNTIGKALISSACELLLIRSTVAERFPEFITYLTKPFKVRSFFEEEALIKRQTTMPLQFGKYRITNLTMYIVPDEFLRSSQIVLGLPIFDFISPVKFSRGRTTLCIAGTEVELPHEKMENLDKVHSSVFRVVVE